MSIHQALIESARQLCAVETGKCDCRDACDVGTCAPKIDAARAAILTFLAHPDVRETLAVYEALKDIAP